MKRGEPRPDPVDELRHANPDTELRLPSDSKARVWARIQEVTMDNRTLTTTGSRRGAIVLAAGLAAGVAALGLLASDGGTPSPTDDPGTGIGACVETYSPAAIAIRDFAFDGTVTAIDGEDVTFTVNERFVGSGDGEVTLTATGMTTTSVSSAGGPTLVVGERYLVAGDETFAWACGFTQPYDERAAAEWAEATQ